MTWVKQHAVPGDLAPLENSVPAKRGLLQNGFAAVLFSICMAENGK